MSPDTPQNVQYRIIRFNLHSRAKGNAMLVNTSMAHSFPFSDTAVSIQPQDLRSREEFDSIYP